MTAAVVVLCHGVAIKVLLASMRIWSSQQSTDIDVSPLSILRLNSKILSVGGPTGFCFRNICVEVCPCLVVPGPTVQPCRPEAQPGYLGHPEGEGDIATIYGCTRCIVSCRRS